MLLFLIRHARAMERDAVAWPNDLERPLLPGGGEAFARLAKQLGRTEERVDRILASPAVRAWQTAEILSKKAGWPAPERCEILLPEAETPVEGAAADPTQSWTRLLAGYAENARIAWVGHEPTLGRIASWLLTGDPSRLNVRFKKGAVVAIERTRGMSSLAWMVTPRLAERWK